MEPTPNAVWAVAAAALAAIIAAVGVSVRKIIAKRTELYLKRMDRSDREIRSRTTRAFIRMAKFYSQIDQIKDMKNVERVLLFFGKDDGGLPNPSKKYTVICRHGWAQDGRRNPEGDYNFDLLVDQDYCRMLADLVREGRVVRTREGMPAGLLKKYYEIEGVVESVLYFLHIDPDENELMFVSIGSFARSFTPDELNFMDVKIDRMRAILSIEGDGSDTHPTYYPR